MGELRGIKKRDNLVRQKSCIEDVLGFIIHRRFSRQAMQTGMNSEVPLILTQIRPLPPEDNYDIISCKNDVIPTVYQSVEEEESGYIRDFVLNHTAQTLWPNVKVTWRHEIESRGTGRKIAILVQNT